MNEGVLGQAYFWACALLSVGGALVTVTNRNPIRSAMGLLVTILSIAGLFLALHAQFLAAIQLIVYAGAIIVLFLFVIMLLGPSASSARDRRGLITRAFGASVFALLSGIVLAASAKALRDQGTFVVLPAPKSFGSVGSLGHALFTDWIAPFELSTALLMVAILGAVAIAKGGKTSTSKESRQAVLVTHEGAVSPKPELHG